MYSNEELNIRMKINQAHKDFDLKGHQRGLKPLSCVEILDHREERLLLLGWLLNHDSVVLKEEKNHPSSVFFFRLLLKFLVKCQRKCTLKGRRNFLGILWQKC